MIQIACDGCKRLLSTPEVELSGSRLEFHAGAGMPSAEFHLCADCGSFAFRALTDRRMRRDNDPAKRGAP